MKTTLVVDIKFGDILNVKDQKVEVETTGDEASTTLHICLPPLSAKISHTGLVTLENGTKVTIEQIFGQNRFRWINYEQTVVVPFRV